MSSKQTFSVLIVLFLCIWGCEKDPTSPQPPDDPNRLLTEQELVTPADSNAPSERQAWIDWIKNHHDLIRSLQSTNYEDLTFLKPLLESKRIVQLGESSHFIREFNLIKVRLIKYLHEELGFGVIAFESNIFECYIANELASDLTAEEMAQHSIFGVWHTYELLDLFEYIKTTQSTDDPLILAGFDVQQSAWQGTEYRPDFFQTVIEPISTEYAQKVHDFDASFSPAEAYVTTYEDSLVALYSELVAFLDANMSELITTFSDRPEYPRLARQTAWSILQFIQELLDLYSGNDTDAHLIRDEGMADNLDFLLDRSLRVIPHYSP